MNVSSLTSSELTSRLHSDEGLGISMGPFILRIHSLLDDVAEGINLHYGDFPLVVENDFADFHVEVALPKGVRRWYRPQVLFYADDMIPFNPLPRNQAFPMLEWGMNWCVSSFANQYLVTHAAVIERNGFAVIMPAPPGSGKSTLAAGLVNRGWRLLSDELTLTSREDVRIQPLPRPVGLKNKSIEVIRRYTPEAQIGRVSRDTAKGDVAHMRPPEDSARRALEMATPGWIIFPKYQAGAQALLEPSKKSETFMSIAENSFNYSVLGLEGFELLGKLVTMCDCYSFSYSDLDEAVAIFNSLPAPSA